jgi:hypothetical protein
MCGVNDVSEDGHFVICHCAGYLVSMCGVNDVSEDGHL